MLEIEKDVYGKYVLHDKTKKKHMYVRLNKAMYRTLKPALLYYRKLLK